jgi:hypothetical protein
MYVYSIYVTVCWNVQYADGEESSDSEPVHCHACPQLAVCFVASRTQYEISEMITRKLTPTRSLIGVFQYNCYLIALQIEKYLINTLYPRIDFN